MEQGIKWEPKNTTALDPVDKAKRSIESMALNIDGMVDVAKAIVIKDDKSQVAANSLAATAKKLNKDIEARRKEIIKHEKWQENLKKLNAFVKIFTEKLEKVWREIDRKDLIYSDTVELERRKQAKLIEDANKKLQADLNKEAEKSGVDAPQVQAKPLPKVSTIVRTEEGTSFWKDNWIGEITDPAQVPTKYCSPDQKKINAAVKQGVREIPGVLIENRKIKSYRT